MSVRSVAKAVVPSALRQRLFYGRGSRRIPLAGLISPLRYDILVRAEHFRFLERNLTIFRDDFPAYADLARETSYHVWFCSVVLEQHHPDVYADRRLRQRAFDARLRAAARLHEGFHTAGGRLTAPITLRQGMVLRRTATGKRVAGTVFAGDGCHRIALLAMTGQDHIEPCQYRIRRYLVLRPLDNTSILLRPLGITRGDYYAFVSTAYGVAECRDRGTLAEAVGRTAPHRLEEFMDVTERDERILSAMWG